MFWNPFLNEWEFSVNTGNILNRMGIDSEEKFLALQPEQILEQMGAGRKVVKEIVELQTTMKMHRDASRDPAEDVKDHVLKTLTDSGLPPRTLLGLLEEIKFIIYARI